MTPAPEKRIPGRLFVLAIGGVFAAMTIYTFWPRPPAPKKLSTEARYGTVIVADGEGSNIRIYEWLPAEDDSPPWTEPALSPDGQPWFLRIETPLSSFTDDPTAAGESLMPLVDYARQKMRAAGRNTRSVPLWLVATEDVRAVPEPQLGALLDDVRAYLMSTGFPIEGVDILDPDRRAELAAAAGGDPASEETWSRGVMVRGVLHLSK